MAFDHRSDIRSGADLIDVELVACPLSSVGDVRCVSQLDDRSHECCASTCWLLILPLSAARHPRGCKSADEIEAF